VGLIIFKTPPLTELAGGGSSVLDSGGLIDITCLGGASFFACADADEVKLIRVNTQTIKTNAVMNNFF
jgi:hypothetical protein